jgi:hypothetical protein
VIESMIPVEGSMFVAKPYDPFRIGRLLDYLVAASRISAPLAAAGKA